MKEIIILGSTGSIGTQTLDVIKQYSSEFKVLGLSCNSNINLLQKQVDEFNPKIVAINNPEKAKEFSKNNKNIIVYYGNNSSEQLASNKCDILMNALVGISGLKPTINAINVGSNIALANKETLVTGGDIIMPLLKNKGVEIYPVDSEHSAIWQCMEFNREKKISKILLTASGGAFRGLNKEEIKDKKAVDALKHPTWNMGAKVTIDSATLMNKGLEVIEAMHLFNVNPKDIQIVIHKESIIHSMVQYSDGSTIAQLSYPDMRLPIQVALNYNSRGNYQFSSLDFNNLTLHFEEVNMDTFPCLAIALKVASLKGIYPTIMNAANEELVKLYLKDKIKFYDIPYYINKALNVYGNEYNLTLDNILKVDNEVRNYIKENIC